MTTETEEEKNARVSAVIHERLTAEIGLPLYDETTQIDAFAFFNTTSVATTETKPMPFTLAELLAFLSPESAAKLVDWPMLGDLRDKVTAQDHAGVIAWLAFITGTKITSAEFNLAYAHLTRTQEVQTVTPIQSRSWDVVRGIPSGPNAVTEQQFAAAWLAAGRS